MYGCSAGTYVWAPRVYPLPSEASLSNQKRKKKLYSGVRILEILFLFVCCSRQGFSV